MLFKFAYSDRKFKNTTQTNIGNYERTLGLFIEYCLALGVINIEEVAQSTSKIALDNVRQFVDEAVQGTYGAIKKTIKIYVFPF